jgi:periplasmic protein TonB
MVPVTRRRISRKLLVASVGVAAVSYVAIACEKQPVGNLAPPPARDAAVEQQVGNLMAPPEPPPPPPPVVRDAQSPRDIPPGNLMPPPPPPAPDAGKPKK